MKPKKCQHYFVFGSLGPLVTDLKVTCHDCGVVYIGKITWRKKRGKG